MKEEKPSGILKGIKDAKNGFVPPNPPANIEKKGYIPPPPPPPKSNTKKPKS